MGITNERINELVIKEKKLDLLEAGGVSDWLHYDAVLEDFFRDQKKLTRRENLLNDLEQAFIEGVSYEPTNYGNPGITFGENVRQECLRILKEHKVDFEDIVR